MERQIRKGDIFYIYSAEQVGSEIAGCRPAIVVSNDMCNRFSPVVEVVYLTTRERKHRLPTHVYIESAPRRSTDLCEQITSVSISRFGNYAGRISEYEMFKVNRAMLVSLGMRGRKPQRAKRQEATENERT